MLQMRNVRHGVCYLQFGWSPKQSSPTAHAPNYCVTLVVLSELQLPPKFLQNLLYVVVRFICHKSSLPPLQLQCNEIQVLHLLELSTGLKKGSRRSLSQEFHSKR